MPNACLLCLKSSKSHPGLSLHKFPANSSLRSSWLKACGFLDNDYGPNRKLCSRHFEEDCFISNIKRILKPKSMPTIHLKCRKQLTYNIPETLYEEKSIATDNCGVSVLEPDVLLPTIIDELNAPSVQNKTRDKTSVDKSKEPFALLSSPHTNKSFDTTQSSIIETPKNKKSRKCFVGDIKTPDLDTPRRAKHHFNQAKIKIMNQRKKINLLHQKVRRLQTKLSNFQILKPYLNI